MKNSILIALLLSTASFLTAADVVHGSVENIDVAAKAITVKGVDGPVYAVTVVDSVTVYGLDGRKDVWTGLKKGSEVVVHGTKKGTQVAAIGLYRVGEGGLKVTKATVKSVGEGGKFVVVSTGKGAEETYHFTSKVATATAKGAVAGAKVVIYSTEKAGKKIAHFFEPQPLS